MTPRQGSPTSPEKGISYPLQYSWASLVAQTVKNLPTMQETWVRSLGWEDPLEKSMAPHSSIFVWTIPMDRGDWQAAVHRVSKESRLSTAVTLNSCISEYLYQKGRFWISVSKSKCQGASNQACILWKSTLGTSAAESG